MKKILALILALAMLFALAACDGKGASGNVTNAETPSAETSEEGAGDAVGEFTEEALPEAQEEGAGDVAGEAAENEVLPDAEAEGSGDAVGGFD
jgi:hypothetical protein